MAFKQLISGVTLVALFALMIFLFSIQFIQINNPASPLLQNTQLNKTLNNFTTQLNTLQRTGATQYNTTVTDNPSPSLVFLIFNSVWSVPRTLVSTGLSLYNLVITFMFTTLFGTNAGSQYYIVFGVLTFLFFVSVILVLWKVAKTGEGER